jgi:hypothetical protein
MFSLLRLVVIELCERFEKATNRKRLLHKAHRLSTTETNYHVSDEMINLAYPKKLYERKK